MDAVGRGSDLEEAGGVFGALGEEEADVLEERSPKAAEAEVAGERAVGDAGVDDGDGDVGARGLDEEARPEFGFDEDEELGLERAEVAEDDGAEVEREVEDGRLGEAPAGHALAGRGGGRDGDDGPGEGLFERVDEGEGGEDFADADGVEPEDGPAGGGFAQGARDEAEAGWEAGAAWEACAAWETGAVASRPEHAPGPEGGAEDEDAGEGGAVKAHEGAAGAVWGQRLDLRGVVFGVGFWASFQSSDFRYQGFSFRGVYQGDDNQMRRTLFRRSGASSPWVWFLFEVAVLGCWIVWARGRRCVCF